MRPSSAVRALALVGFAFGIAHSQAHAAPSHRCLEGRFRGITETSEDGSLVGRVDRSDWGCLPGTGNAGATAPTLGTAGVPAPLPSAICFEAAAPNPATGGTYLRFTLPASAEVRLEVYGQSVGGGPPSPRVVRSLLAGTLLAGTHSALWDLRDDSGARVVPGIYRAILRGDSFALCGDIEVQ